MTRNQFLDMQKKRKDYTIAMGGSSEKEDEFRSPVHEQIVFNEYSAAAKIAIGSLSPQRKRIFLLRYENDLSFDEIAATLHIAKTTAKKQLYEAVKLVKDHLQQHGNLPVILIILAFPTFPFR